MHRSPILKHAADDPHWHGWDKYEGEPSEELPIFPSIALDERYYGNLQGLNKTQTAVRFGENLVHEWRRSFSARPPGGESLQDTMERTVPFFRTRIITHLKYGDCVLVIAHGNSLRSIIMELDHISEAEVPNLEVSTGIPVIYDISTVGKVISKVILN